MGMLDARVRHAAHAPEPAAEISRLLQGGGTAYVIGTGGSFPAALHIASVLELGDWHARAVKPADFCARGKRADLIVCVSYSGGSRDIAASIAAAYAHGTPEIALCTGNPGAPLAMSAGLTSLQCWGAELPGGAERGFLSVAGTVAPAAAWSAAFDPAGTHAVLDTFTAQPWNRGGTALPAPPQGSPLHVLGTGFAAAAMADLESGCAESHLPQVMLHESKDFSHGRYLSGMRRGQVGTLLGVGALSEFERALIYACWQEGMQLREVVSAQHGHLGSLELLLTSKAMLALAGRARGLDLSRPADLPASAKALYSWRGPLV